MVSMSQPLPPLVQSQAMYQELVRHLTGLDPEAAEQAVINHDLSSPVDVKEFTQALQRIFKPQFYSFALLTFSWAGKSARAKISPEELDQVLAFSRVYSDVRLVMDEADAARWMIKPNRQLNGKSPLEMLQSRTGERRVRDYLDNLLHGNFA